MRTTGLLPALDPADGSAAGAPGGPPLASYWEERARRFARRGRGLAAVCSYGMPAFHNLAIDLTQRLALDRWLRVPAGTRVLELGCGVGRWTRRLARRGARVVAIDHAPSMLARARERAEREGWAENAEFVLGDVRELDLGRRFDLVLAVTVLQHLESLADVGQALAMVARHLAPGGRAVLLEAAPTRPSGRCDTPVFQARSAGFYLDAAGRAGLDCRAVSGVDPAPFRRWLLPSYRRLPRPLAWAALLAATACALPLDLVAGRLLVNRSWHKLFVAAPGRA